MISVDIFQYENMEKQEYEELARFVMSMASQGLSWDGLISNLKRLEYLVTDGETEDSVVIFDDGGKNPLATIVLQTSVSAST